MDKRLKVDLKELETEVRAEAQAEDRSFTSMVRVLVREALEARRETDATKEAAA